MLKAEARAEQKRRDDAEREAFLEAASRRILREWGRAPVLRRRREAQDLRRKFRVGFVEPEHYPRVMAFLKRLNQGERVSPEDFAWMVTYAEYCFTPEMNRWGGCPLRKASAYDACLALATRRRAGAGGSCNGSGIGQCKYAPPENVVRISDNTRRSISRPQKVR